MDAKEAKLETLSLRQDMDRLADLYQFFQRYVERLAAFANGECVDRAELLQFNEALRLRLREDEHRFFEWRDGEQLLNPAIFFTPRPP